MQSSPGASSLDSLVFLSAAEREKPPLQTALALARGKERRGAFLLMSCSYKSLRWLKAPDRQQPPPPHSKLTK